MTTEGIYEIKREQCMKCREKIVADHKPDRDLKQFSPAWRRWAKELQQKIENQPFVPCLLYAFECAGDGGMIALCHEHLLEAAAKVEKEGPRLPKCRRPSIFASS
jgi:hypothetical protein